MMRTIEVYEVTCDGCIYFGDPQADPDVPDGWAAHEGQHFCPDCAQARGL